MMNANNIQKVIYNMQFANNDYVAFDKPSPKSGMIICSDEK